MRRILTVILLSGIGLGVCAQTHSDELAYRRNALAMMLVYHPEDEFGGEIQKAFDSLPIPDKYDDHNVGLRIIDNSQIENVKRRDNGYYKATYGHQLTASELKANALHTEQLLNNAEVAKWMVARWFNLHGKTTDDACFDTQLIQARGQYNATDVDVAVALQTTRGLATLSDAGEELLGQSFVLVNDITYVTAEQEAAAAKTAIGVIGGLFDAFTGGKTGQDLAKTAGAIADSFTGFKVKTHSYLYRLVWNDSVAAIFYTQHYTDHPDPEKLKAFVNDHSTYKMQYVAHEYEFDKKSVLKGKYSRTELVRTICARSMDKNIVALAKQYEDFKVKTPVYKVLTNQRGKVEGYAAKIGMKEGITDGSKFQVVERVLNPKTGKTSYRYIATVKAVKGKVWDNRYNAVLEEADGATLPYTTFQKTAGGEILPGMLLIEGKYKKIEN
ncbi:MAG: hypothetical protein IJ204_09350 [Paludibacteraceae bacterium]|nr:hypothetical protein [Paludibacteraceae bacterium]